jgi:phycocyanobilin:ferredoxin oxidoreductase
VDILSVVASGAESFRSRLLEVPGTMHCPVDADTDSRNDFTWTNLLLTSPSFRHAHVETFGVPGRISVLHVCIFPHHDDPGPIFGFDMIAGHSKVTGIFLDLSGTISNLPVPRLRDVVESDALAEFVERRPLPAWGTIFSPDVLAIRPVNSTEIEKGLQLGLRALGGFLSHAKSPSKSSSAAIGAGQQRYIDAQRQNEHTFRMLSGFVGMERARKFIDETLFPSLTRVASDPVNAQERASGHAEYAA